MKLRHSALGVIILALMIVAVSSFAQVKRPYHNGSVWNIAYIRMKPGMETSYMDYLAGQWKTNQEAAKKDGLIMSYKVIEVEGHNPGEFNVMLMTEYKDLATMEAGEDKADSLTQKVVGDDETQRKGYRERLEIREVMGNALGREIVLEPRK